DHRPLGVRGLRRVRDPHHPARGRPLRGRQGRRDARGEVHALLRQAGRERPPRRDRVRDQGDPARWLREDHRDEPQRGDPAGGGAP
ncbi:MAG: Membrane-associated zinc metalloprotease, partial [uncultured Solirubrobacteraceae bacterium]